MTELIALAGCDRSDRTADIVFVHGLDGHPRDTWSADPPFEDFEGSFWPMWLSEALPYAGIWTFGYEANASGWFGPTMPLTDRATNMLAHCQARELGLRPLLFITHSMGGLLVKQVLRHGRDLGDANWRAIVEQTKGVVFLSTPHTGAGVASWLDRLHTVLRLNVNVNELRNHDRRLSELNTWYRDYVTGLGIKTLVFCENEPWRGLIIVDQDSADPGIPGVIAIPADANHNTICKPKSREDFIYTRIVQFARDSLAAIRANDTQDEQPVRASPQIEVTRSKVTTGVVEPLDAVTRAQITDSLFGMRGAGNEEASLQRNIMEAARTSGACTEEWRRLNDRFTGWMLGQYIEDSGDATVLGFTRVTLELTIHIVNRGGATGSIHLDLPSEGTVSDSRWTNPEEPLRYRMNVPDGASAVRILRPSAEETLSLRVQLWPEIEYSHDDVQGDATLRRLRTASAFAQYLTSGPLGPFTLPDTEINNPEHLTFEVEITRNRNLLGFQPVEEIDRILADWQRVRHVGIKEFAR